MYLQHGLCQTWSESSKTGFLTSQFNLLLPHNVTKLFSGGLQIPTSSVIGNIEFRDVNFTYPSRQDALIFSGLNLNVPAGSVTAVVGSSGSGKSTIGGMLLRFYDPDKGIVLLYSDFDL